MKKLFLIMLALATLVAACEKEELLEPENTLPEIISATSVKEIIKSGEQVQLNCEAMDQDGDSISFLWNSAFGSITLQWTQTCFWTAPVVEEETVMNVYVSVNDDREPNKSVSQDVLITVLPE